MASNVSLLFNILAHDEASKTFDQVGRKAQEMGAEAEASSGHFGKLGAAIGKASSEAGKAAALNAGKATGIAAIGSAALAAATPLGAMGLALGAFAAVAAPELKSGSKGAAELKSSFGELQKSMAPLVNSVIALGTHFLKDLMPAIGPLAKAGAGVISDFLKPMDTLVRSPFFAQFVAQVAKFAEQAGALVGPALVQLMKVFMQLFIQLMPAGMKILGVLLPLFVEMAKDLTPVIVAVANITASVLKWLAQTHLLIPVLGLLGVAILVIGGPIGALVAGVALIVVAIVELSKHWKQIWGDIKQWAQDAWNFLTHGWGQFLVPGITLIRLAVDFFSTHWKQIWDGIKTVAETFWQFLYNTFYGNWKTLFTQTIPKILTTAWNWIDTNFIERLQSGFSNMWHWVVTNVWNPVKTFFSVTLPGWLTTAWNWVNDHFLKPFENGFHAMWTWVVDNVGTPIHNFFTTTLPGWFTTAINWINNHFITPFKNGFKDAWDWIVDNVWDRVKTAFTTTIPGWFKTLVSDVGKAWTGFQNTVQAPVKWVFQHVFDPLASGFDTVTNALGLGKPIPAHVVNGWSTGGHLPGYGGGDIVPALLEPGETVVSKEHSQLLVNSFRAIGVPGYASGGTIPGGSQSIHTGTTATPSGAALGPLQGIVNDIGNLTKSALTTAIKSLVSFGSGGASGEMAKIITAIPTTLVTDAVNWLFGKQGASGSKVNYKPGAGVNQWRSLVLQALKMEGLSTSLVDNVLYQMQTESGGNPNAINNYDINAQNGDPSRGLMQTIMSTFLAYHWPGTSNNIYNPLANIAAALNYARHVYGPDLANSFGGIGSGHGYANGGFMQPGEIGLVGENGPELIQAGPTGNTITPFGGAGGSGGGFEATLNLMLDGQVIDKQTVKFQARGGVMQSMQAEIRRAGGR